MKANHEKLDEAILLAIAAGSSPHWTLHVNLLAREISQHKSQRLIERRMQAMRKAGRIVWLTKREAVGHRAIPGWNVWPLLVPSREGVAA